MAERVEPFDVTFPAGTLQSAPITVATPFVVGIVEVLEVDVPPGPSGVVGFRVLFAGVPVFSPKNGTFIIADDKHFEWKLHNFPTDGRWSFQGYNIGAYDHTLHVRFFVNEIGRTPVLSLPTLPIG